MWGRTVQVVCAGGLPFSPELFLICMSPGNAHRGVRNYKSNPARRLPTSPPLQHVAAMPHPARGSKGRASNVNGGGVGADHLQRATRATPPFTALQTRIQSIRRVHPTVSIGLAVRPCRSSGDSHGLHADNQSAQSRGIKAPPRGMWSCSGFITVRMRASQSNSLSNAFARTHTPFRLTRTLAPFAARYCKRSGWTLSRPFHVRRRHDRLASRVVFRRIPCAIELELFREQIWLCSHINVTPSS